MRWQSPERLFFLPKIAFSLFGPGWHGRCNRPRERNKRLAYQPKPLEDIMKIQKLIVAVAVFAATASVYAQQTEFVAPDAGMTSTLTRAEVRQEMLSAYRNRAMVQQQHTGQDPVYAKGQRSREEVRAEAAEAARHSRAGDVESPYFG
jgi:hypothetical protein